MNVSLGWDYQGFSILGSAIYQSSIFNSTNFWNALRTDKKEYLRLDIVAKQKLPWYNVEVFLNLNNLNGANDTYIIRGNNYESDESYGLTAQLGIRVNFNNITKQNSIKKEEEMRSKFKYKGIRKCSHLN